MYTFPASQLELPVMYCGSQLCFCLTHPICQEGLTTVDIHLEGVMRGRQGQRSISESLMSISHQSTGVWSLKESVAEFKWRILKPELTPYFSAANPLLYLFKMEAQLLWKSLGHVRLFLTSWITCPWTSPGQNTGVGSLPFSRGSSQPRERTLYQLSHKAVQYYISYRCSTEWFTIFKGYTPFIGIIKCWLYSICCNTYPCSLFYTY